MVKADLLILDDWGPDRLNASQRRDLMEIIEDRYGRGSTLITSQLPVEAWHDVIGEPTFADAILDRIVHVVPEARFAATPTASRSTAHRCARSGLARTAAVRRRTPRQRARCQTSCWRNRQREVANEPSSARRRLPPAHARRCV